MLPDVVNAVGKVTATVELLMSVNTVPHWWIAGATGSATRNQSRCTAGSVPRGRCPFTVLDASKDIHLQKFADSVDIRILFLLQFHLDSFHSSCNAGALPVPLTASFAQTASTRVFLRLPSSLRSSRSWSQRRLRSAICACTDSGLLKVRQIGRASCRERV